jgi:hypothetical protein
MSALPPQLISSSLQSALQQHQAQQARSVADRRRSDVSQAVAKTGEQHETQIDNTDADSQVQSESSSSNGGQGRAFHEEPQPDLPEDKVGTTAEDGGDGKPHLDITA